MKLAHIIAGVVVNVSIPQPGYSPAPDEVVLPDTSPVGPGWTYSGVDFSPPVYVAPPEPPKPPAPNPRRLTKLEFIGRMTQVEIATILADSLSKPAAMMFVRMLDWATPDPDGKAIDLDDPRTKAGVQSLFNAERTAQILA